MSEHPSAVTSAVTMDIASITDRGLSQKRPLNEDSMLVDAARGIFAVADGVGGAQAGEVASKTAVEVLGEAFRHHRDGDDIEDLMEIAIQRANASIFQMSHEQRQLSMMATTLVALHLDGHQATIGHVGDSRLYRLTPEGKLQRETEDHSVVEEEVRAGRMSPQQAANHPSRNIISRALGAEQSVEVDMKSIEVEDGTVFLLCSDGITRHIPDAEIGALLNKEASLEAACAEMKRRCYERGAEDNLTAVVVRVGGARGETGRASATDVDDNDAERTILTERPVALSASTTPTQQAVSVAAAGTHLQRPLDGGAQGQAATAVQATSGAGDKLKIDPVDAPRASAARIAANHSPTGRASRWFGVLLLLLAASAGAFYGGMRYQNQQSAVELQQTLAAAAAAAAIPSPTPPVAMNSYENYIKMRAAVDATPGAEAQRMAGENNGKPLESTDPLRLTLYGRALLLSGKYAEAVAALKTANEQIDAQLPAGRDPLRVEARMMLAAAALRSNNVEAVRQASDSFGGVIEETRGASANGGADSTTPSLVP